MADTNEIKSLDGRKVVILGGTGGVGEGIVRSFLHQGATVIVPSRSEGKADHLRNLIEATDGRQEQLHTIIGQYGSFTEADALAQQIETQFGPVDDVVASIGGWWMGKALWQISNEDWQKVFVGLSTAHMAALRAFMPKLPKAGAYTLILGGSAYRPVPSSGLMNMEQAALVMMRTVAQMETGPERRIFSLVMGPIMTRMRRAGDPNWVTADQVGDVAAALSANAAVPGQEISLRTQQDATDTLARIAGTKA